MSDNISVPPGFVWTYPGEIDSVYDGDTPICHILFHPNEGGEAHGVHVRVEGINAPELNTAAGKVAKEYAETLLTPGLQIMLVAHAKDKYGRFLARIILPDGTDFGDRMIESGNAVPYMT